MPKKKERQISFSLEGIIIVSLLIQNNNDKFIFKETERAKFLHLHFGENEPFQPVITDETEKDWILKHKDVGIVGSSNSSLNNIREMMRKNTMKIIPTESDLTVYVPTQYVMDTLQTIAENSKSIHPIVDYHDDEPFFKNKIMFQQIPFKNLYRRPLHFGFTNINGQVMYISARSQMYGNYIPVQTILDVSLREGENLGILDYLEKIGLIEQSE